MKSVLLLLVVGCGSSAKQPDAAPPDVAVDAPPMPIGTHYHYILDSVSVPTSSTTARQDGLDIDGNGTVDNQLGAFSAAMLSQASLDVQAIETRAVDDGAVLMLADLQATDLTTATAAGFTMYVGTNPNPAPCNGSADTVCRHQLDGTGTFDVAATPRDPQLVGTIVSGVFVGGPGHLSLQLSIGGGTPTLYTLLGARTQLTPTSTNLMQGKIGGAITVDDVQSKLVPAMQTAFASYITRDCSTPNTPPDCGCITNSIGGAVLASFDHDHDCTVPLSELENTSLIMSLLQPDVFVEGKQCLSIGVAVTGVGATFTP